MGCEITVGLIVGALLLIIGPPLLFYLVLIGLTSPAKSIRIDGCPECGQDLIVYEYPVLYDGAIESECKHCDYTKKHDPRIGVI